ncbi:hypothetical protein WMY93_018133 [Mugilogobius chulae]|uniref:DRBM domain-containing protein n=1 Tax=Mugilogobius chulae TaxID=88201 RepID=A0AAW0NP64_9GOBI
MSLLDSKCVPWGLLYTISVSVLNTTVIGTGPTETAAKNNAAAEMLKLMGLKCPKYNALMDNKHQIQQDIWESPDVIIEDIYEEFDDEHQELREEDAGSELNQANEVSQTSEANPLSDLAPPKVLMENLMAPKPEPEATIPQDQEVSDEKNTITDQLEDHEDVSVLLEVFDVPRPDEPPVLDSDASFHVDKDPDVLTQSVDVTLPPSGQELTPDEEHVCEPPETEKSQPDSTTDDPYVPNKLIGPEPSDILPEVLQTETGSEEQSLCKTQCERHHTSDLFALSEVVHTIGTGSVEQSLCETHLDMNSHTAEMSEGSYQTIQESERSLRPLDEVVLSSDQVHLSENIKEVGQTALQEYPSATSNICFYSQEKPTSPQIQDEPSVAYFLIRALVQKLIQKQHIKQEDQAEMVSVLLKNTTEHISNQDVQMSIKDMRYVARAAAKDLLRDSEFQRMGLKAEDKAFQEAVVKHLNNRLTNFLFGPKQSRLARLLTAVRKFFRCTHH